MSQVSSRTLALPHVFSHYHTFWRGQLWGCSRISLCAFRLGLHGGARTSRVGANSCNPRLGLPGEECRRNWWCLSTWGHSLGQGKKLSLPPKTIPLPGSCFPSYCPCLPSPAPYPPHLQASSSRALVTHR